MDEREKLIAGFDEAMFAIYRSAEEIGYRDEVYFAMLSERRGLATAKQVLGGNAKDVLEGFTAMYHRGRLDLTLEALALREPWRPLFTEAELRTAEERLRVLHHQA